MKIRRQKPKMHRLSMSSEEMIFTLFAFRKGDVHEHFLPVRMRLTYALRDMGLDSRGEEFDEFTKRYEKLFSDTILNQTK